MVDERFTMPLPYAIISCFMLSSTPSTFVSKVDSRCVGEAVAQSSNRIFRTHVLACENIISAETQTGHCERRHC